MSSVGQRPAGAAELGGEFIAAGDRQAGFTQDEIADALFVGGIANGEIAATAKAETSCTNCGSASFSVSISSGVSRPCTS